MAMMIMKTSLKDYCNVGCNETEDDSYDGNGDVVNDDNNDNKVTGEELALRPSQEVKSRCVTKRDRHSKKRRADSDLLHTKTDTK